MTLTELSFYSRKYLPFGILAVLVLFIVFYMFKLLFMLIQPVNTQRAYINPIFDKITVPLLREATPSAGFNYILDTIEGRPVTASESAKVYFMPASTARFGYKEKIYLIAKTLGFDTEIVKYKLNDKDAVLSDLTQKLTVDITNFNFYYQYHFEKNKELFENIAFPSKSQIENKAIDFLKSINRYPEELAQGKINLVFFYYNPETNELSKVNRSQEANVVEVDMYRPDVDGFSTITTSFPNSQNFILMVFKEKEFKILRAQIKFYEKSNEQVGVYPLRTGDVAWEEFKKGRGYILSRTEGEKDITVKTMFTAYLDPEINQKYLQPVYVFLGSGNFVGILPAVDSKYLME